ncbi:putative membrane protein [Salsuginibacillus halophilus]|uniref:Putative membrane protein n=1 Tax=Salsuginibacillus halophilus TaxID=517424 RepID=A0A2P8H955_9BACI|nr:phage holin family protein [Salsuginibacillus halophilus]PSL42752.1 putative membrane protein [Salsuginibacillus halophilus]
MGCLIHLLVNTVVLMVVAGFFTGFDLGGFGAAIVAAVLLGLANAVVKPILVILTLPITVVTLGLFLFVINALILMAIASLMGDAFVIDGFGMALLAAVLISLLNLFIHWFIVEPVRST